MSTCLRGLLACGLALAAALPSTRVALAAAPASSTPDPCALLSDGEVAALLGQAIKSKKPSNLRPGLTCTWRGSTSNLVVTVETEETFKAFNAAHPGVHPIDLPPPERMRRFRKMQGANAVDVPGVGEEALWDKSGRQLWFIKHGRGVIINIDRHNPYGMADDLEGAKAAALKVAPKV
jgi:hypothetical protein